VIRALIFDFNGVIADDETAHVVCFQQALEEANLTLTKEDYYGVCLGMDERTCIKMLLEQRDGVCDEDQVVHIGERKAELFRARTHLHTPPLFPGVAEFVLAAKARYRLAIASGGRQAQIEAALAGSVIEHEFDVVVAAEDCPVGKPDPAIYLLTCERLNADRACTDRIRPSECLVIEDSVAGIRSAKAAGMRVAGLATTYPVENLSEADMVLPDLQDMTPEKMIDMLAPFGRGSRFQPF
jgi:HAD superfamily hydrolase (TIGR01509 family)